MDFLDFCAKIWYRIYLSILWMIGCIPIFTIGASTTAYCTMLYKIKYNKEGYMTKGFIREFKDNFKISTKVWLIAMVAIIILYLDSRVSSALVNTYGGMYNALVPVYYLLLFLVMATILWVFPYIARFNNTMWNYIKNAFLFATRHLGYTITTMLLDVAIILCGTEFFLPILLFAPMLIGVINVSMLNVIFKKYIEE